MQQVPRLCQRRLWNLGETHLLGDEHVPCTSICMRFSLRPAGIVGLLLLPGEVAEVVGLIFMIAVFGCFGEVASTLVFDFTV